MVEEIRAVGRREGIEMGRAEGRIKGKAEGRAEALGRLVRDGLVVDARAAAMSLGLDPEEVERMLA